MKLRAGIAGILSVPALLFAGHASAQDVASQATVIDDPALPHVLASTHQPGKRGHGWAASRSVEIGAAHLRAHIDRESGTVRWQLWQEMTHAGLARSLTSLVLDVDGRPSEAALAHVERQPERCPAQDALVTACTTRVHYAFDVPAGTVARMAESAGALPLAFRDTIGRTFRASIHPAEVAALSSAVETLQPRPTLLANNGKAVR